MTNENTDQTRDSRTTCSFIKITNRSSPIATIELEEKTTVSNTTNRCCRTDLTRYRPYCLEPSASSSSVAPYSEADPYGCEKVVKKWQPAHPATLIYKMKYNMNQEKMDTCTSRLLLSATRRFTKHTSRSLLRFTYISCQVFQARV